MADSYAQTEDISREGERLKYLNFVHLAAMQAVVCLAMLYQIAKKNSGPLKPGVYLAEGAVKVVIGPVCERFRDVPFEFLKFLDHKTGESLTGVQQNVAALLKSALAQAYKVTRKAPDVALSLAGQVWRAGAAAAAAAASGVVKEVYVRCELVAERYAVAAWRSLNRLLLFPQVAQVLVRMAAYWAAKYNSAVETAAGRGYAVAQYLPTVPIEKIASVFLKDSEKSRRERTAKAVAAAE